MKNNFDMLNQVKEKQKELYEKIQTTLPAIGKVDPSTANEINILINSFTNSGSKQTSESVVKEMLNNMEKRLKENKDANSTK